MISALGSPIHQQVDHTSENEGNANAHSNLFNLNLNFKEFKLGLPIAAIGSHAKSTHPTHFASDLSSDLSSDLASPSFATAMASPRPRKTTNSSTNSSVSNIGAPVAPPQGQFNLLNKSATTSTGIYQQSVLLRSRLQRLPAFAQFLEFSHSGTRASRDVVQQLWEMFSLGKPLCVLFNLQSLPPAFVILEYADDIVDPDPLRKERQRAIALFIMGVNNLKNAGYWEKDAPLFSISELVGDAMDTNGFVKVVATVLYLLDRLPPSVWSETEDILSANMLSSQELAPASSRADVERANLVRELIETERKYCQDLEIMQSYAESLRERNIVDADTIHNLFPALGKLTDFQRKLLIHMEATAEHNIDEQDWGQCFAQHEPEFSIYDAYIANYSNALDLAVAEQPILMAASNIINPMQLPAFLIKPVQRLCRYPMLLGSLLKLTPAGHMLHPSLLEGVAAVKRIADGANRALRAKENDETWEHTLARIRDWKGLQLDNTGSLLLDDLFSVVGDRRPYAEYHIFLFNRMLLLCRPKETQTEAETTDKEKKGDWLTPSFKRSQSSSSIAVAVQPPTPNGANPSSFFSNGAVASRRAKTPLSIRGSFYIRNIMEITPETSAPYAIHIKYKDRIEENNWTLNCRNEEQVNLWHREIQRLRDLWKAEEKDIRRSAKATLQALKEQAAVPNSSLESLDSMRSARRPVHPYHYTFESGPTRTRARNGSLDLGGGKPDLSSGGNRNRSCSVTSVVSDMYDPREDSQDKVLADVATSGASQSAVDLSLSPGTTNSNGDRSAASSNGFPFTSHSPVREPRRSAVSHTRSPSQTSEMSIGYVSAVEQVKPVVVVPKARLSGRVRASPLPPQPPAPLGPQPPLPSEELFSRPFTPKYEGSLQSRQSSPASGHVKPLPVPPTSNLRHRVGDRLPAPLVHASSSPPVPSSGNTPQSTLPELPSKDARRPLSNRKSSTPLRGPRERGSAMRTPVSAQAHEQIFDAAIRTRSRSRSHSNPLVDGLDPRKPLPTDAAESYRNVKSRHRRQGSESSNNTMDSVSIFTTSEEQGMNTSPITPPSSGEESKSSPVGSVFTHATEKSRLREPHLVSGRYTAGKDVASGSKLDLLESPPSYYAGVTPKTSQHVTNDRKPLLMSGNGGSEQITSAHSGNSQTRSTSATGSKRTEADGSMIAVRLHYDNSRFTLRMSHTTTRRQFIEKIRQKIRLCGATPIHSIPHDKLDPYQFSPEESVSYMNDASRFVALDSDADFAAAWKSVRCRRMDPADNDVLILAVGPTEYLGYAA